MAPCFAGAASGPDHAVTASHTTSEDSTSGWGSPFIIRGQRVHEVAKGLSL